MVAGVTDQGQAQNHELFKQVDELVGLLSTDDFDFDQIDALTSVIQGSGDVSLQPVLEGHLAAFLDAANWFARDEVARLLYELFSLEALPALLKAMARDLHDDQDNLSTWVVELFHADRTAARLAVLDCVAAADPELRRIGIWGLDFVGEEADLAVILAATADEDPKMRSTAIGALSLTAEADPRGADALRAGTCDADPGVRISAISKLGWQRSEALIPLIVSCVDDPEPGVREFVAHALGRIGSLSEASRSVLERLRTDVNPRVRDAAGRAITVVGPA